MKQLLIIFSVIFVLASCGTAKDSSSSSVRTADSDTKQQVNEEDPTNLPTDAGGVITTDGLVKDQTGEGCGFVIEVLVDNVNNKSTYLQPIELPADYQVDGKPIRFSYRMSRRPSTCDTALPIVIDEIVR